MGGMMDGVVVVLALVVQGKDERLRCTLTHTGIPLYLDCWHESMIHAIFFFLFPSFLFFELRALNGVLASQKGIGL